MVQPAAFGPVILACLVAATILSAGCTSPAPQPGMSGSVSVTSIPQGGEVYLDSVYRGTAPLTIPGMSAGNHTLEVRRSGSIPWSADISVSPGGTTGITASLVALPETVAVTIVPTPVPVRKAGEPQIHIDGYWEYAAGRSGTENPAPLIVHTEVFNTGTADAREITVAANFYYESRMICFGPVYLGTLAAGGHLGKDTLVTCPLPSGLSNPDLSVRFENLVVKT